MSAAVCVLVRVPNSLVTDRESLVGVVIATKYTPAIIRAEGSSMFRSSAVRAVNSRKYEHMLRNRLASSHESALFVYDKLEPNAQLNYIRWIVDADHESTRIGRINKAVLRLSLRCQPQPMVNG